jgi:hypothetical protein
MTHIWCGIDGWCYLFNAVDVFSRKWIGYCFVTSTKDAAIQCAVNAIASEKPDVSKLLIRTDNDSQYISKKFRESVQSLVQGRSLSTITHLSKTVMLNRSTRLKKNTSGLASLQTTSQLILQLQRHLMITTIIAIIRHWDTPHKRVCRFMGDETNEAKHM